uniref:Tetratricopeptide repeat protein 32-like n=1 Tax=Crassostrea virginica TaxID=6565 RepID=A0A8B8D5F9_CRAVI|nr:tetratricopeptide repeat protein 32-like [Crassostrea virginica]
MEEAEKLFEEAKTCEANSINQKASALYTEFINHVHSYKDNLPLTEKLALAYNNRGFLKYKAVDFDDAIADYTESLKLNPKASITYYNRGTVLYRLSKFDDAILDMKQALRLDPGFEPAQTGLLCAQKDRENKLKRGW